MLLMLAAEITIPLGLDLYMPVPQENPLTRAKIEQGRRLFFDRRLSRDGSVSCSSCHDPERAFSDGRPSPSAWSTAKDAAILWPSSTAATAACFSGAGAGPPSQSRSLKPSRPASPPR